MTVTEAGEDITPAHQMALTALEELSARGISPIPEHYTVWYVYLSNEHPALRKEINRLLKTNVKIDEPKIKALFETYFGVSEHNKEIELVTEKLITEMKTILDSVAGANIHSGAFAETLGTLSTSLAKDGGAPDLQPVINAVAKATQTMARENQALGNQLSTSTSEINQLKADLEDMRLQAMTDGLTGLANRKCFDLEIENAIQFAEDEKGPLCLLMLDVDHFKKFNDTHGHQTGDQVLKLLADVLSDSVKGQDTPARYGGEEFSIILPETPLDGAIRLAEALRNRIIRRPLVNKMTGDSLGKLTISVGAAQYVPDETSEEFIARADKALYGAKTAGRDQVVAA